MFCTKCGQKLPPGAGFCPSCGTAAVPSAEITSAAMPADPPAEKPKRKRKPTSKQMMAQGEKISANITLCADGKYRWVYAMSLFKNPSIFLLIWKIFFFIIFGMFIFLTLIQSGNRGFWWDGFLDTAKVYAYILIGMTALIGLGYLLYAAIMGGKYIVEFEMDEKGVNHKQIASQAKKAKKLGRAAAAGGLAVGRFSAIGAGISAQRTEMYSSFEKVRKVKAYPRRHIIKVNERFGHNQVFAAPEDFEFVKEYIIRHCPNLK